MIPFVSRLRAQLRQAAAWVCHAIASPGIFSLFRRPDRTEESVSVHMLVSSQTWHAGVLAVMSFEHFTQRRWRVFIHEDGSVSAAARSEIERLLPGVHFVARKKADARAAALAAAFPRSVAHRAKYNLYLKFADTMAFADRERFIVLDSDVIFFKRPAAILEWVDSGGKGCWYNEDTREKFCLPREEIQGVLQLDLLPRFNSGLVLMQRAAMNPRLAEKFFELFEEKAHAPKFFEQTLYAVMASTNPERGGPLPRTYNISWGYWRDPGSVCRHYVGEFKHDLLYIEGVPLLLLALLRSRLTGCRN
jgi:hypothetical protein